MKQILIIIAFLTAASFSSRANDEHTVNPVVLKSFEKTFTNACDVNWIESGEVYIAEFKFNNQVITAYYSSTGTLMGLKKNILSTQLPVFLEASLKEQYKGYWITDLMEYGNQGETTYYVTLENADQTLVLKSSLNTWSLFHKAQK